MAQPDIKWRYARNIATGNVVKVSSSKCKELVRNGTHHEVAPPDGSPALASVNVPANKAASPRALLAVAIGCLSAAAIGIIAIILKAKGYI